MTSESLYAHMDADYSEALRRIGGNERMVKYLRIMRRDPSFDDLCEAVENQDYQAAFRAAHAIKGASLNLGLTKLADCSSKLTEALRSQEPNEAIAPCWPTSCPTSTTS